MKSRYSSGHFGKGFDFLCHAPNVFWILVGVVLLGLRGEMSWGAQWTGAGEISATQTRTWIIPNNWVPFGVPLANDQNFFNQLGDGTIDLKGMQQAGAMFFSDFTYTNIVPDLLIPSNLSMVNTPGGNTLLQMREGVRDTYGVDYFTAGPQFTANVVLSNTALNNVDILLGNTGGSNSSMMFSGLINSPLGNSLTFTGFGLGASLWITSTNAFSGAGIIVTPNPLAPGGVDGYALHLAGAGRMNGTPITLSTSECFLGLQDNTGGGSVPPIPNQYLNRVDAYGGNIFTDRSYQQNDLDPTVNAQEYLRGGVTIHQGLVQFGTKQGTPLRFGRTNNGYTLRLGRLDWTGDSEIVNVNVNNGNLTENRGGSRYVSGANRLQESHNYVYVDRLVEKFATQQLFMKGGTGVLAVDLVNNGLPGGIQQWTNTPWVYEGVLRMGIPGTPHNAPSVMLGFDAGLGIGWNTNIDLRGVWGGGVQPFPILPAWLSVVTIVPGQAGAVDIDMWGHNAGIIDTNIWATNNLYYLRIGSSMGDDASFDTQPNPLKHASVAFLTSQGVPTQIIPYIVQTAPIDIYYFGGGGGTLQIDSQLVEYEQRQALLEMGTTGKLLPGRVALNPGGMVNPLEPNLYTGPTEICAGTLQLMKQNSVYGTAMVNVWTYDQDITNGLYANPSPCHHPWEQVLPTVANYAWTGPGQLLLDPGRDPQNPNPADWSLFWYTAQGGAPLYGALSLDGGVIGWTRNVDLPMVPGFYGTPIVSNLKGFQQKVNVLGLGGEYSAGTMKTWFQIMDAEHPVLLYKAGKNSVLDLTQGPSINTYTGGTIIAGGEIRINDAGQLNAHEGNEKGGPIVILNGGRLHCTLPMLGSDLFMAVPIMVNTDGTPDMIENCGSVIDIDAGVTTWLFSNFDFSWNPCAYLEKDGSGILNYNAWAPTAGTNNAWGLKLTDGRVVVNQLPVNPGIDSGPVIFNNGNLEVAQVPAGMMFDTDPAYGFRNMVSMKGTSSTVIVNDNAMFRTHGIVPSEILGTVKFVGKDMDGSSGNNIVHLSRNTAPATALWPTDASRGNGTLVFQDVTVYMSGTSSSGIALNVLPCEAGFKLILNDGTTFHGSAQNPVFGEVNFNNTDPTRPVQINGAEAAPTSSTPVPYSYALTDQTWSIGGTGYTTWSGIVEKIGTGTVEFNRQKGTAVSVNSSTLLRILNGTLVARGTADPFTDTLTNFSLDIENNSTGIGLEISEGTKTVDVIFGTGDTWVWNGFGSGTILNATSITQNSLNIGVTPPWHAASVPEPSTLILLVVAVMGSLAAIRRKN